MTLILFEVLAKFFQESFSLLFLVVRYNMTLVLGKVIGAGAVRAIRVSFNHSLLSVL